MTGADGSGGEGPTLAEFEDFGESVTTTVHPFTDIGSRSPVGIWFLFGNGEAPSQVEDFFVARGAQVTFYELEQVPYSVPPVSETLRTAAIAMALLMASTAGAYVVARSRWYAIERLHGTHVLDMLGRELAPLGRVWVIGGVCVLPSCAIFDLMRYGGAGLAGFLWLTLVASGVLFLVVVAGTGLTLAMMWTVEVLGALKGELAFGGLAIASYGIRIVAILIALSATQSVLEVAAISAQQRQADAPLAKLGNVSTLTVGNAFTEADQDRLGEQVGAWLADLDEAGALIAAVPQPLPGVGVPGQELLIVNQAFVERQPVSLDGGEQLGGQPLTHPVLVVPPHLWAERATLIDLAADSSEVEVDPERWDAAEMVLAAPDMVLTTLTRSDADLAYSVGTVHRDPLILVLPTLGHGYTAAATAWQVQVTDPDAALADVTSSDELTRYVLSISPVSDLLSAAAAARGRELQGALLGAITAALVVLMSGVAATLVRTRRHAARIWVRHLHGWTMPETHLGLLLAEAALLALTLAWLPVQVYLARRELAELDRIAPLTDVLPTLGWAGLLATMGLAVVVSGGFWITLRRAHHTIVHQGRSEA
ncbi:MAG: hypothetical protein ACK5LN_02340 [Propioniciclava sp.]